MAHLITIATQAFPSHLSHHILKYWSFYVYSFYSDIYLLSLVLLILNNDGSIYHFQISTILQNPMRLIYWYIDKSLLYSFWEEYPFTTLMLLYYIVSIFTRFPNADQMVHCANRWRNLLTFVIAQMLAYFISKGMRWFILQPDIIEHGSGTQMQVTHQKLCSRMVTASWTFYSNRTQKCMNQTFLQIHCWEK